MNESIRVCAEGTRRRIEFLKSRISDLTNDAIHSGKYFSGEKVAFLEKSLSQTWNSTVVATNSTNSALQLALLASGVNSGDEVLLSALSPISTAYAITAVGGIPVFIDIDPQTFTIDVQSIEEVIGGRSKAIIATHSYGLMADMQSLMKAASKYDLKVIEDVAQSSGATYNLCYAGTVSDFGCFSMGGDGALPPPVRDNSKRVARSNRSTGRVEDGGIIAVRDLESLKLIEQLLDSSKILQANNSYIHRKFGFRSKMGEFSAAIINLKLQFLPQWNFRRQEIAERYNYAFAKLPIQIPIAPIGYTHVYSKYPILTQSHSDRLTLENRLANTGIQTEKFIPKLVPDQAIYSIGLPCRTGCLDKARNVIERLVYLPMYPELTDEEVEAVIIAMYNAYEAFSLAS
ncbi:MAG: DegT/DnrJ/EryC1/StrS family aminotransferase [Cyanobacteria bacterium P01_A01_bin.45]